MCKCMECAAQMRDGMKDTAKFCSDKCRNVFNNRRARRGAELYDLFMAMRYDRETARALKVWTFICKVSQMYRDEDNTERGGRPSWFDPRTVMDRKPWLRVEFLGRVRA